MLKKETEPADNIWLRTATLDSGRYVQCFVNKATGRVIVDVIAKNEMGGSEVLRLSANEIDLGNCEVENG